MLPFHYATVCSGIECMSVACRGLPLKPVFFSEIEPFPCAVLKAQYPDVPNLGDMSEIQVSNDGKEITNGTVRLFLDSRLDILAGGTPCTDISLAGKRAGMSEGSGTRSSLAFEFVRLARELRPRFIIWENVAADSIPAKILLEPERDTGNTPPSRNSQVYTSSSYTKGFDTAVGLVGEEKVGDIYYCLDMQGGKIGAHFTSDNTCPTLTRGRASANDIHAVILPDCVRRFTPVEFERLMGLPDNYTIPIGLQSDDPSLVVEFQLIFDKYNAIIGMYDNKNPTKKTTVAYVKRWLEQIISPDVCPDAPRYKVCGNGWAINQIRWILIRLLCHLTR